MPMSAAAMEGISHNGHRWRYRLNGLIEPEAKHLGLLNDLLDGRDDEDQTIISRDKSEPVVMSLIKKVRGWVEENEKARAHERLPDNAARDLTLRLEDLECVEDCSMAEINFAMNELYDVFDYYRILT